MSGFAKAALAKLISKERGTATLSTKNRTGRTGVSTIHRSSMLIDVANGKLEGTKKLLPNELNNEKRNTQVQVGGEGGADIRIVNCFVTVFLSFSLLAFALFFPGFSARKERTTTQRDA